jgi:uncharacterized protein YciI
MLPTSLENAMSNDIPPEVLKLGEKFYGKTLFVVMTRPASPEADLKTHMIEHLHYQIELEKKGIMFAAGPLSTDDSGWPGTGMFILRAKDFDEARAIADADPMHRSGARVYSLQKWRMHEGRITLSINLSDSSVELA